jgi:hypothetical protein
MLKIFLRRPTNAFLIALCIAPAIALASVSLSPNSPFNQRSDISAEQSAKRSTQSERSPQSDEASEYWTIFGHHLKITDTLLVLFTFTL